MTSLIVAAIAVILLVALSIYNAYTKYQQELNDAFEAKLKAIYNAELNEYFMKRNIEQANAYNQSVNTCRCGYDGDDDSVCSNCGKSLYKK